MVENIRIINAMVRNHQILVKAFSAKVSFVQTLPSTLHSLVLFILIMNNFVFMVSS